MRKVLLFVLGLWGIFGTLFAQEQDFNTWYNFAVKGELFKKLNYSIEPEVRLFDNSSRLYSWQTELDVSTPVMKHLDVGGLYRYQVEYDNPDYNRRGHRWTVYAKFDYKVAKFKWSYKAQFQTDYANYQTSGDGLTPAIGHRHKLTVEYNRKKWWVVPSAGIEYYFSLQPSKDAGEWKYRYFVALERKINKRMDCKLAYKRQNEFNVSNPMALNILSVGIGYQPKFLKSKK